MMKDIWVDLATEGNFPLIEKLRRAERKEPGFRTIVVPRNGFSDRDSVHNAVLTWLQSQGVLTLNTRTEIASLVSTLTPLKGNHDSNIHSQEECE